MGLAEFKGPQRDHGAEQTEDPKADDDLAFLPALQFKVVVDWGHLEKPARGAIQSAADLEPAHLQHHGHGFHHKNAARDDQHDLLLGTDRHGGNAAADGHAAGIAHEDPR